MGRSKKKYYKRAYMRKHFASNTYVSNDGEHIERDYVNPDTLKSKVQTLDMWIERDTDRFFVKVSGKGHFYVDEMVLSCYKGTMKDGKKYLVHHKDGDMRNSHINNLEWREETPEYVQERAKIIEASVKASAIKEAAASKKALMDWYRKNKVDINEHGEITQRGNVLYPYDYIYDSDMDWTYHNTSPRVSVSFTNSWGRGEIERIEVEKIMFDFGKIVGNPDDFENPVVLYQNFDYLDTTPGNLVWCDASDQRYIDFKIESHKRVMEKDHESNHWLSELSWKAVYGENEPYQDWSDKRKPIIFF